MEGMVYLACCPVCGRSLCKGRAESYIEAGCPKCKKYLQIMFTGNGVKASVIERTSAVRKSE